MEQEFKATAEFAMQSVATLRANVDLLEADLAGLIKTGIDSCGTHTGADYDEVSYQINNAFLEIETSMHLIGTYHAIHKHHEALGSVALYKLELARGQYEAQLRFLKRRREDRAKEDGKDTSATEFPDVASLLRAILGQKFG